MPVMGDDLIGLAYAALTLAGVGVTAGITASRKLAHLGGPLRVLAVGVIASAALVALHLLAGIVGILSRGTVAAAATLAALATALLLPRRPWARNEQRPGPPGEPRSDTAVAWAAAAIVVVGVFGRAASTASDPLSSTDVLSFDLPILAAWVQTSSVWTVTELFPGLGSHGTYPHNGHMALLAAVLPFGDDSLVRMTSLPYLALAWCAVLALGRELGAGRSVAALAASVFVSIPVVWQPALDSMTDTFMLAMFGAGTVFGLRYWRSGAVSELALAGVALGLAFGTKWYAVAYVPLFWAAGVVVRLRFAGQPSGMVRDSAMLAALIAAFGGFWLLRNVAETGNPLYPVRVAPLGLEIFDAPRDIVRERVGFTLADYAGNADALRTYILPAFRASFGLAGALCACGVAAAALALRADRRDRAVVSALVAVAAAIAAVYLVTPYSAFGPEGSPWFTGANTRYLAPSLLLGAALGAHVLGRLRRLRVPVQAVAVASSALALRPGGVPALAAVVAAGAAVALAVLGRRAAAPLRSLGRRVGVPPQRLLPVGAALGVCLLAGVAIVTDAARYRGIDPVADRVISQADEGTRIAVAGFWAYPETTLAWPLHGSRLENELFHVGGVKQGRLEAPRSRPAFAAALHDGDADLLILRDRRDLATSRRAEWARAAGFTPIVRSERLMLFARRPPPP